MREILFRGKRVENGEWVEGVPVPITINSYLTNRIELVRSHSYDELDGFRLLPEDEEVIPETLGQYIGLRDKHGTKIFEGDIILAPWWQGQKIETMKGLIEFSKGAFSVVWQGTMYGKHFAGYVADMEVIGNIFDNPKLWEEE